MENEVYVVPMGTVDIPITFRPSAIGAGNHAAEINFTNDVVGCLTFTVSGVGDPPEAHDDHVIQVSDEFGD